MGWGAVYGRVNKAENTAKEPNMKKLKSGIAFVLMFVMAGAHILRCR
jgi:hypothetical protein